MPYYIIYADNYYFYGHKIFGVQGDDFMWLLVEGRALSSLVWKACSDGFKPSDI